MKTLHEFQSLLNFSQDIFVAAAGDARIHILSVHCFAHVCFACQLCHPQRQKFWHRHGYRIHIHGKANFRCPTIGCQQIVPSKTSTPILSTAPDMQQSGQLSLRASFANGYDAHALQAKLQLQSYVSIKFHERLLGATPCPMSFLPCRRSLHFLLFFLNQKAMNRWQKRPFQIPGATLPAGQKA